MDTRHLPKATAALLLAGVLLADAIPASAAQTLRSVPRATDLSVRLTIDSFDGQNGRRMPVFDGYRPHIVFYPPDGDVNCAVRLASAEAQIEPGSTAEVTLSCASDIRIYADSGRFTVYEGGRVIGHGVVAH
ncbi:MAG: hypothetical protein KGI67_00625 [Pseudomonadota bacterium]|nr:hypothetical protein [Pseudomonadota bacterium]